MSALVIALEGAAQEWSRTIPYTAYLQGGTINGIQVDPMTFVMHAIASKYSQVSEEARMQAMLELMAFDRRPNERIDDLITRFEGVIQRANTMGQMVLNMQGLTNRAGFSRLRNKI